VREREILERSVHATAQHARDAYALIEEIHAAGFPANGPTMLAAKRLRMQLLTTKGALERELGRFLVHCRRCDRTVHWVPGVGPEPGHWAHAEPASAGHPPVLR
jgi:hypothetical protein